ncbi:unnamed protein product [Urochloa humidicola]
MGAERARRWKLFPSFRSFSLPPASPSKPNKRRPPPPPPDVPLPPSSPAARKEPEAVPAEFLCPILRAPMADPVILPSGRTYERACVRACAELGLSLSPDAVAAPAPAEGNAPEGSGVPAAAIPNDALRAAVRTWCARSGRAPPVLPSADTAREAVLRAVPAPPPPPERTASNLSCSSEGASAASTSSSSSSSGRSSREMAAGEVEVARVSGKEAAKEKEEKDKDKEEEPARVADAEAEAVVRAVEAGKNEAAAEAVEAAISALRRATRESPARRRALCDSPLLLASLRRVLLSSRRHTPSARADAAAALSNLALEPENRVPLVRAGAVPALVDAVASSSSSTTAAEAREHAAGALFGLALHEGNRAAIGVLGALPPLLAVLAASGGRGDLSTRARRDAGMALYHLSMAAVNQSKLARHPGASRTLLAVAGDGGEPAHVRRLALMVCCNVAGCAEGRAALMDAGAVAAASGILSAASGGGAGSESEAELREWCVAALYAMSRGSPRFRGLARAAGADRPLMLFAEQASPGVHREMAEAALRTILGLADISEDDDQITEYRSSDGGRGGGGSRVAHPRRRVASWSAPPPATPASSHQWRSVCID